MNFRDPRSYVTKGGRVRLFGVDYRELSFDACQRARETCECGCGERATWLFEWRFDRGELAHNEHGARKSDELDRVKWMRHECHMKSHNCAGKPIAVTKKSLKAAV